MDAKSSKQTPLPREELVKRALEVLRADAEFATALELIATNKGRGKILLTFSNNYLQFVDAHLSLKGH